MKRWIWWAVLVLALAPLACADDDDDDNNDNDNDDTEPLQIDWQPCSLEEDANDGLAECGEADVPLFWDDPAGKTITVGAKRWLADGDSQGQLWLIQGGPGASGMMTFAPFMEEIREVAPEFDLYTIDHRGVGYSSHLSCPEQEAEDSEGGAYLYTTEFPDCAAYLEETYGHDLDGYSTANAAHDLAAFIDATREDGKTVFVWGGSYGTYLTQRYLLLHPDQADGAIVDSIHAVSQPGIEFSHYRNENGKLLMQRCADDPFCAGKLGADPWATLATLHEKVENGHCPLLGIDRYTLAYLLGWLSWYSPLNVAVPAFIYRLDRCDYADAEAIVYLWENAFNGSGDLLGLTGGWFSQVLSAQIGFSDQYWSHAYDDVDLEQYFADLMEEVLIGDISTMEQYELYAMWPKYDDPRTRELPQTAIPVLMQQGGVDGSTPVMAAEPLRDALDGAHQTWLLFPNSAHGVSADSWLADDPDAPTCGLQILAAFLRDPESTLDASCIDQTAPLDFAGYAELADYLFGTDDLWENDAAKRGGAELRGTPIRVELPPWVRF
jgi:pimeloyl-ACP methyl ester carboxylesterase